MEADSLLTVCFVGVKVGDSVTVNNLTELGPWEAGSIVKNVVKIVYCSENIDSLSWF